MPSRTAVAEIGRRKAYALACLTLVALGALLVVAPPAPASPNGIVVSEFRFRGPNGGNDEFVELRNASSSPVDVSGYRFVACNSAGPSGTRATVPASTPSLAPGRSYLFVNTASPGTSVAPTPDQAYNTGIADTGGARIEAPDNTLIDRVGSTATTEACREGSGLTLSTANGDNSFERKPATGATRNSQDTNDNAVDFEGPKAGNPENRGNTSAQPVTKISAIQGSGASSPLVGQDVTIEGVVTGIDDEVGQSRSGRIFENERGIFVQEESGDTDGNPATSEGIFVGFVRDLGPLTPGTVVRLRGRVRELFGFTIIEETINQEPEILGSAAVPDPVEIDPTQAASQDSSSRSYYESLEAMRVRFATATANSGGTNKFDELFLTPGTAQDRVFRGEIVPSLFATDEDAGSGNPTNPDNPSNRKSTTVVNADLFDTVNDLVGPLAFSFGTYKVMTQPDRRPTVQDTGVVYPFTDRTNGGLLPFDSNQIRVLSYNLNNYFDNFDDPDKDDEFDETTDFEPEKRQRATDAINNILERPDVLSVQEAENKGVLDRLATSLGGYTAYLEEGNDNRSIDVGFLIKDNLTVTNVRQLGKEAPGPAGCSDVAGRLFDRPPLAADVTAPNGLSFTVFGSHFAAKGGSGSEDGRGECREAQARFLRERVQEVVDAGGQAVIAGDLNAFEDEQPLEVLEADGLLDNQFDREADPEQRYSFQFQGRLQTLDHVLVTQGLTPRVAAFQYAHFNIDYFERERPSDSFSTDGHKLSVHDPPIVTLNDASAQDCRMAGVGNFLNHDDSSQKVRKDDSLSSDLSKAQNLALQFGPASLNNFVTGAAQTDRFKLTNITSGVCSDDASFEPGQGQTLDTIKVEGEGTYQARNSQTVLTGYTVRITIKDGGESGPQPGAGRDFVHVKVFNPQGQAVNVARGKLKHGNQDARDGS